MYDLRPFIQSVEQIVARHRLKNPGEYTRWLTQNKQGTRDLGSTPYGCANAVNILYTIGALPDAGDERQAMVRVLQEALPGYIRTSRPLKLVLDVRPFL